MLKFIGSGSAFNTKLGNNSAYYKEGNQMLLIDCGSDIFQRIKESDLLKDVEQIHVLVTHTHADHVGSLADLILYAYYSHGEFAKKKVVVHSLLSTGAKDVLRLNGVLENVHYDYATLRHDTITTIPSLKTTIVNCFETKHVDELNSFGFELSIEGSTILYTGDASDLDEDILEAINTNFFDYAFIDTCKADYNGNVHLSLRKLTELIKSEARDRVYCMHLDEGFDRKEARKLGFNVVVNDF